MYRWDPEDYHSHSPEQQKWGLELLNKIVLAGGERVLDIGCGDGRLTAEIALRVPRGSVLGIDKSHRMVRFAHENCHPGVFANLTFLALDANDLSFHREFDVIFSNAVLHWISPHLPLLRRIEESLRKGGMFAAQMGGKGNASGILNGVHDLIGTRKWAPYFRGFSPPYTFYSPEEYGKLLAEAGLTVKRIELIDKEMVYNGSDGLSAWIRTTWLPYTRRVPDTMQADFVEEIVDTFISNCRLRRDGIIPVHMVRLEFEAVREL